MTPSRAMLLGVPIDRLDMEATVRRCEEIIDRGEFAQHVSINAAKVVAMREDTQLRRIVHDCELISADGQSIVWASRLLGDPIPERVAGIDLMGRLLELAERRGYRIFLLGARSRVLDRAVQQLLERHPRLQLAGWRHGYFADSESRNVCREIRRADPDILFVAMSSPRKELWLAEYGRELGVALVMGVGGSLDVVAGKTQRAPRLVQRIGFEWLYRLAQEPRRLGRRYVSTNFRFVALVLREALTRRVRARSA